MSRFGSVLVANRGEIAVRVMRTARRLGYRCIAVYSAADAAAPHVAFADDAVCIGPAPAGESYLDAQRILDAARATGAEAIHPGYGFLSENADFARAVSEAGLVFVGPSAEAIELMGNKAAAKRRMQEAGVPCVPGYQGEAQDDSALLAAAADLGFPLMVKAAAGGGGRGMRLVAASDALPAALRAARSEARNAFGSDELILERAILRPRHVEIQVFGDEHGNIVHLGERDCSVQRRHQKVVEEAPCPVMTPDLRARMGDAAVEAARSIVYVGAGTVEFLLDAEGAFYFLEMNTRLQVEHPVTEAVTGLDLVALQLQVAQGRPLDISQNGVELSGHAIELRLYAEDPARDFLPASGRIVDWRPADGAGIRVDAGIATGQDVPPYYDPMLAKLVAWGEDRPQALRRLRDALRRSRLFGVTSNREFLAAIVDHPDFAAGRFSTAFIDEAFPGGFASAAATDADFAAAGLLLYRAQRERMRRCALRVPAELLDWHSGHGARVPLTLDDGQRRLELSLSPLGVDRYTASVGDRTLTLTILELGDGSARLDVDGSRQALGFCIEAADTVHLAVAARTLTLRNVLAAAPEQAQGGSGGRVAAPMHGVLVELLVQPGDRVEPGGRLAVLEAMKMQHELLAPVGGTVREVSARAGQQVAADELLFVIEEQEA